jgi:hypothetical protein
MRKLRNIDKMNDKNFGNRDLFESLLNYHVVVAMKYLISKNDVSDIILINDLGVCFYSKPYMCKTIEILVRDVKRFKYFPNNKFRNGIELKQISIKDLNISDEIFDMMLKNSYKSNNINIASPAILMSIFLKDFDIINKDKSFRLLSYCLSNNSELSLYIHNDYMDIYKEFIYKINKDYYMKYLIPFEEHFFKKCNIFEGNSGYAEVDLAFKNWIENTKNLNQVLIGGMAMVNYIYDRTTTDVDFIFLSKNDVPTDVTGFKKRENILLNILKLTLKL